MVLDEVLRPNWVGSGYGPYGGAVNTAGDLFAIGLENSDMTGQGLQLVLPQ